MLRMLRIHLSLSQAVDKRAAVDCSFSQGNQTNAKVGTESIELAVITNHCSQSIYLKHFWVLVRPPRRFPLAASWANSSFVSLLLDFCIFSLFLHLVLQKSKGKKSVSCLINTTITSSQSLSSCLCSPRSLHQFFLSSSICSFPIWAGVIYCMD